MDNNKIYRRLPLKGLYNARELGGFPTKDGGVTKYRRLIRCESTADLTPEDVEFLKDYGVTLSIDFRGSQETDLTRSKLKDLPWVKYIKRSVFNEQVARGAGIHRTAQQKEQMRFIRWGDMYISIIKERMDWVKDVIEDITACDGAAIFNCTTGKDRTGVMAAVLLGLAGAYESDIIADYAVSQIHLLPVYRRIGHTMPVAGPNGEIDLTDPFFKTAPENMEIMIDYIIRQWGSFRAYVSACGVSDDTIDRLLTDFVER